MSEAAATAPQVPAGGNDPNINLPRSVRRQAATADQLHKLITQGEQPPAAAAPQPNGEMQMDPSAPPAQPVTGEVTQQPPAADPQSGQPIDWERRYRSMEGRYRKTAESLDNANARLTELEGLVRQMQSEPRVQPASVDSLLTPEEINDYGPEFIDLVKRTAAEATRPLLAEIGRLKAQVGHVDQKVETVRVDEMHAKMDQIFPQWRELNENPRFIEWSQLHDTYSGAIRQRLMQEAWNRGEARRCAAFFQGFLAEEAAMDPMRTQQPPAMHTPPAPLAPVAPQGRITLESLAAPGSARSAAGVPPAEKPMYSPQQITQFYVDVANGKYRGREAEKAKIEADIHMAQFEGRILDTRRGPRDQFMK